MADERSREQVSVVLPRELRVELERVAQQEDRSVSGQVRHYVARALAERPQVEAA